MNKLKDGYEYELYVQSIIKSKYKNVWLWKDVPPNVITILGFNNCDDIGCDIIAETNDNIYHYIQCKNYSTTGTDNTIYISDLAGFYNFVAENELSKTSFVYYSGKLSSQVVCRTKIIKYINLPLVSFKSSEENQYVACVPRDY